MNYEEQIRRKECSVERTVDVIGGKWTTLIVRELLGGTRRYGEVRAALSGVSPKTLTDKLRELEEGGILTRTVYPAVPPRVDYTLTDKGRALEGVIRAMQAWGDHWT